ncbi:metallophosphoesterase [Sphingomonas qomolangmaensis]|uniref:Metallophosphoesterase n=1 Tax=Sphingomonas qomolangmaensis TaxID=2918765 RepID=A0ABY5L7G9_9SPHN|nr:metallophosphoesterase [Sphingomonas qomolangmaensis]UUL82387.1 metallophosphoesterase [Sphingomonas qomolangmaensis]
MRNPFKPRMKIGQTEPGERIYAVGDVHGRYDLMRNLLSLIMRDWEATARADTTIRILFLGDIIDRGPDSRSCIMLLQRLTSQPRIGLLRGNHEDLMLRSLDGEQWAQDIWMEQGGLTTLNNYGVAAPLRAEDSFDFAERLLAAIPPEHIAFLRSTPLFWASGTYFFAHAGVRPGVSLYKQDDQDLISIRNEFLTADAWHGAVVVHGHSIVDDVDVRPNRIAVDTGAWQSNRLSCVVLDGTTQNIITT